MSAKEEIQEYLLQGDFVRAEEILHGLSHWDKELTILNLMMKIFRMEVECNAPCTVFDFSLELNELAEHFVKLKLLLRRLDFELPMELQMELYDYCSETQVSDCFLIFLINNNVIHQCRTCQRVAEVYFSREGRDSDRGRFFLDMIGEFEKGEANESE